MMAKSGYEKCAHLYDLFDTKENVEFFLRYASEAGEGNERPLSPAFGGIFDLVLPDGSSTPARHEPYGSRQGERKTMSPLSFILSRKGRGDPFPPHLCPLPKGERKNQTPGHPADAPKATEEMTCNFSLPHLVS